MKKNISFFLTFILVLTFVNPIPTIADEISIAKGDNSDKFNNISIAKNEFDKLPNQVKLYMTTNKDARLLDTTINHYRIEENNGEVSQELIRTFNINEYQDFELFRSYRESLEINTRIPRKGRDLFVGVSAYSIKSSYPTAYQVQGWWEWDRVLGVYHSNWDVVGLTFYGETKGSNYSCFANGVYTGVKLYPAVVRTTDNGAVYRHTVETLSEGAVLGRVVSSNSNSNQTFRVKFTYEYFGANPNPSYLAELVKYLVEFFVPGPPPLPSKNQRFPVEAILRYGS